MKQLIQNLKTGDMKLLEVPFPALSKGHVLVRNHFSLISAGTEESKVKTARSSLLYKAKQKPEQVKLVIDSIKSDGLMTTYQKVMNKLETPASLGYSCAGKVIEVSKEINEFKVGDIVACGGEGAVHAEVVSVPKNLCVKVPQNLKIRHAAYTTVASIALQGIRQSDLRLGECCAVIGLGLIGQLTVQMLKAAGIKVAGIDINQKMVDFAIQSGADLAFERDDESLENSILEISNGYGVDAVIITAGTSSLDPVELAGKLCRKKGKVVIVGAVPTGFSRPNYYKKELELKMSCSYGSGRYETNYEEKGLDYPIGYVRWTENRNMKAFLELTSQKKLNLDLLTTNIFNFEDALNAYQMIMHKSEPYVGILLKYDKKKELEKKISVSRAKTFVPDTPNIGFIGAGSFAQRFLLPNAKKYGNMIAVATATANDTKNISEKYRFKYALGNAGELIRLKDVNTVFIATRHDTHAEFVLKALRQGKNVFVEKPLCMREEELEEINTEYKKQDLNLMLGFNRRFSYHTQKIIEHLGKNTKKAINYRINVGNIPPNHWTQDPDIGGGRIIGEVCHFLDLSMFICNSKPVSLTAYSMDTVLNLHDTLIINVKFENGSIATISYFSNGNKRLSKEYLEVYGNGITAIINDFKKLTIYGRKKLSFKSRQDKGHAEEVKQFLIAVRDGAKTPILFEDIYLSTKMTFDVVKSIRNRQMITY